MILRIRRPDAAPIMPGYMVGKLNKEVKLFPGFIGILKTFDFSFWKL